MFTEGNGRINRERIICRSDAPTRALFRSLIIRDPGIGYAKSAIRT